MNSKITFVYNVGIIENFSKIFIITQLVFCENGQTFLNSVLDPGEYRPPFTASVSEGSVDSDVTASMPFKVCLSKERKLFLDFLKFEFVNARINLKKKWIISTVEVPVPCTLKSLPGSLQHPHICRRSCCTTASSLSQDQPSGTLAVQLVAPL